MRRERCSSEILSVKKEENLPGRGTDEEEVGNGDVDLRWSSLLTVCQRRRGLVEDEAVSYTHLTLPTIYSV